MAAPRLLWRNRADYADVTASSEAYGLPGSNVQQADRYRVWLTGSALTDEYLIFDLYEAQSIQAVVIENHDLSESDTDLYVDGDSADTFDTDAGDPEFSQAITWRLENLVEMFTAAQEYRYWRIRFTKASATYQRQLGRVFLGPYYEVPRRPRQGGVEITNVDLSETVRAASGVTYTDVRGLYQRVRLDFARAPAAQVTELIELEQTLGLHTPWWLSLDHANFPADWLYYGKLRRLERREYQYWHGGSPSWNVTLELEGER